MPPEREPNLSLFVDILYTLEDIQAPYVIIGAFAGAVYGVTRTTFDIDMIVDLSEDHIHALAAHYPLPRYYADPYQMRNSIRQGIMFNIIDTERGEKADLLPVTMHPFYKQMLAGRTRQQVEAPGYHLFEAWCARMEDVIVGKLLAWREGRSHKHERDIFEMLVFHHAGFDAPLTFDESAVHHVASLLGDEVGAFWLAVRETATREAERIRTQGKGSSYV